MSFFGTDRDCRIAMWVSNNTLYWPLPAGKDQSAIA